MIKRLWFLLSIAWAVLLLVIAVLDAEAAGMPPGSSISGGLLFVALGPLFIGRVLGAARRFVAGQRPQSRSYDR